MRLQDLRPTQGLDVAELHSAMAPGDWPSFLPKALSDDLLLRLAREFRIAETLVGEGDELENPAGALSLVLFVVLSLVEAHPSRKGRGDQIDIAMQDVFKVIEIYQWAIEREIASRILGISTDQATEHIAQVLSACVVD